MAAFRSYLYALLACATTALIALPLLSVVDLTNIAMLFLLAVAFVAARLGSGPAVLASFVNVALFDWFFVPPRFSWEVADVAYLITFAVMLVVALGIGELTARLRKRALEADRREAGTRALYEMAKELSAALTTEQVTESVRRFLSAEEGASVTLHLPPFTASAAQIRATFESSQARIYPVAERGFEPALLLPLRSSFQTRGVLEIASGNADTSILAQWRMPMLEAVASLAAIAVERIHYNEVARDATLRMESERLRAALLAAVSHDLSTPLTAMVGLADSLALGRPPLPAAQADTAAALRDQSLRLSRMVDNLLDMARLQIGGLSLRKEWQPLDEVVGSALLAMETQLQQRRVHVELPATLPLLEFDAVLLERVLCNLLDNAAKYAPTGDITIAARQLDDVVEIAVSDQGPGIPPGREAAIFELFERGAHPAAHASVGLGLSICRAIVEAHGGRIRATSQPEGGTCIVFSLPLGQPPVLEDERGA